ncbi:hypothetical protein K7887_18960 [Sutcliffiella horikoshii]|uniref:hypothetical protein n=1 Tax=Sutcliffiella horikoshii TaxID=79883 RepID=UPI001CBDE8A7|nr:hypothetical protein [Sutcliffiella horikoshii]UAL46918.1 hypothetical protein K7887_18960 [Sutcliffiella horikoshii]
MKTEVYVAPKVLLHQPISFETAQSWNPGARVGNGRIPGPPGDGNGGPPGGGGAPPGSGGCPPGHRKKGNC